MNISKVCRVLLIIHNWLPNKIKHAIAFVILSKLFVCILDFYDFIKNHVEKHARYGIRVPRLWIANQLEVDIDDPKHLEVVLTNTKFLSKSSQYSFLNDSLGEGLLFSTNKKWFSRRRVITPTFHFKILEQFFDVFIKHNQILMRKFQEKANGKVFDIFPLVTASVMNAILGKFRKKSRIIS